MNISYKWLKRYIDFSLSPRELAAALTSLGLECDSVEEVESVRGGLRGVVVGKVLTCAVHPNSDHLHITTCDLGTGEPVQIVCGAPNVAAGQTVVVATVGTTLYNGDGEFKIKKSKIRGEDSFGMICAEDEIGLGSSHDGIMVLPPDAPAPGTPAAEYFGVGSDYRLEVELTPNRVDGASHYGVARDLKAYLRRHGQADAEDKTPSVADFTPSRMDGAVTVEVEDSKACPRYSGVTIRNIKVAESPKWLKELLEAAGQRPINNIVDITNFILLGLGQPLHCFDLAKVKGEKVVVRNASHGERFVTLDGVERTLDAADLMICDAERSMCIAGVFGGLDSGVTEATTDVFIESAWFNPTRIRKTARHHGLSTDASFRYERGTDPNMTVYAARLAALLIRELAGGEICGEPVDIYPEPVLPFKVELSLDYCNKLIGKVIPADEVKAILRSLEIAVVAENGDVLSLEVPNYRVDVQRPCDVVEEILRVYGYNNVEISPRMHATLSLRTAVDESYGLQNVISDQLSATGYREILNNSLTSVAYYEENPVYPAEASVRLLNPLSNDLALLRQSLLYGGLEVIAHNVNRKNPDLALYEFGNVYHKAAGRESTEEKPLAPYGEENRLALWLTGLSRKASWNTAAEESTVFDLKAAVMNILNRLGIPSAMMEMKQTSDELYPVRLDIATRSGKLIGFMALVGKKTLKRFGIAGAVAYADLSWEALMDFALKTQTKYKDIPKTQPVNRDLALLLDKNVSFGEVEKTVRGCDKKLLRDVALFDVYEGDKLPEGKKSYAISIVLQDDEKTLLDKQIDAVMQKIIKSLESRLGARLR